MSRVNLSTQELFLRLGTTPRTRTVRANQLFRKLRDSEDDQVDFTQLATPQSNQQNRRKKTEHSGQ